MARARAGNIAVSYVEHGAGDNVVVAVHDNLGCADWLGLVLTLLPPTIRVTVPFRRVEAERVIEAQQFAVDDAFHLLSNGLAATARPLSVSRPRRPNQPSRQVRCRDVGAWLMRVMRVRHSVEQRNVNEEQSSHETGVAGSRRNRQRCATPRKPPWRP